MQALFDSNILIDLLAGLPAAIEEAERYTQVSVSIINWIEVMSGAKIEAEEKCCAILFTGLKIINLNNKISTVAVEIRRERTLKLPDAVIQATAEVKRLTLVTRNTKDFPASMPGVRIPYTL